MHLKTELRLLSILMLSFLVLSSASALAQLTPKNESGVTIGHVHWLVPNPQMHEKLWVDLFGAQVAHAGALDIIKLPGVIILINPPQGAGVPGEPTADHIAFLVRDLAAVKQKLASANIQMADGSSIAAFPDGVRVEFIEDKSLGVPVAFSHYHLYAADVESIRSWYIKTFGGIKFPAGPNFPGGEVRFTAQSDPPRVPTKGHVLDHIGFEVKDLPEFCKKLEAQGTKLDMKILEAPQIGLRVTFITDLIGTRIELTEGLADK